MQMNKKHKKLRRKEIPLAKTYREMYTLTSAQKYK